MSFFKVRTTVTKKDGTKADEVHYVKSKSRPKGKGVEKIPRMPKFGEEWKDGGWHKDNNLVEAHKKEAELNHMSRLELAKAIKSDLISGLMEEGIITGEVAKKLRSKL